MLNIPPTCSDLRAPGSQSSLMFFVPTEDPNKPNYFNYKCFCLYKTGLVASLQLKDIVVQYDNVPDDSIADVLKPVCPSLSPDM